MSSGSNVTSNLLILHEIHLELSLFLEARSGARHEGVIQGPWCVG